MKQKYLKKAGLLGVSAVMAVTATGSYYHSGSASLTLLNQNVSAEDSDTELAYVTDSSMYTDKEVFVSYKDDTYEVLSFDTQESLEDGLSQLEQDESVVGIQPNYEYETTGSVVSDTNFSEQWALYNDGTFTAADETEEFPVYTNPFEEPVNDKWNDFMDFFDNVPGHDNDRNRNQNRKFSSYSLFSTATTATAGIDINIEDAWDIYNGGERETIVAIIDTGVDYTHEELADSIWINDGEIAGDGIDNDGNGYIDDVYGWNFYSDSNEVYVGSEDSHGTHGAGTIAATRDNDTGIAGIAGNSSVKVMIVKALGGSEGSGSTESIIKAIQYAEDNGAVICNLSFGTSTNDSALKKAIANSSMLFVAAAGNGDDWTGQGVNDDTNPIYPAAYDLDNIISVANLSYDGNLHYSSNYGSTSVDLAAPGSYILSTTPENGYSYMTGTSMAAPMVTGVAAMIYSQYTDVTLNQVKEMILLSAKSLDSLSGKVATGGMLDASAALSYDYSGISSESEQSDSTNSTTTNSAPVISSSIAYSYQYRCKMMTLTVEDEDNDVEAVYYGTGTLGLSDFEDVSSYTKVTLNSSSKAYFQIVNGGTYTFYAVDEAGNASVYTVTLNK